MAFFKNETIKNLKNRVLVSVHKENTDKYKKRGERLLNKFGKNNKPGYKKNYYKKVKVKKYNNFSIKPLFKIIGKITLLIIFSGLVILSIIYIPKFVNKIKFYSGTQGINLAQVCPDIFLDIPDSSLYGVIIDLDGGEINDIRVLKIRGDAIKGFFIDKDKWVKLQYSTHFKESQVSQLYRTAKLETLNTEPECLLIKQISFLSGVPFEFAIFKDGDSIVASNLSNYKAEGILKKVSQVALSQPDLSQAYVDVLPDGTEVKIITYRLIADQFGDEFILEDIVKERSFVEVYNATGKPGYASFWARNLKMLGLDVSRVGNAPNFIKNKDGNSDYDVVIYVEHPEAYGKTLLLLQYLLSDKKVNIVYKRPEGMITTGDIILILLK